MTVVPSLLASTAEPRNNRLVLTPTPTSASMRITGSTSRRLVLTTAALCGAVACDKDPVGPLDPQDFVGMYALTTIDGHQPGWYHQLGAVDCRAAFTQGGLTIRPDLWWRLELAYDFRCLGADPFDGTDTLYVTGSLIRPTPELIVLNGFGPDLIGLGIATWSIEVRPLPPDSLVEVRFREFVRQDWADPVFTMGPRKPYDGSCFVRC